MTEILRRAIAALHYRLSKTNSRVSEILEEQGFIGCADGPPDLSTDYKDDITGRKFLE